MISLGTTGLIMYLATVCRSSHVTGLPAPGNWCYMNWTIYAIICYLSLYVILDQYIKAQYFWWTPNTFKQINNKIYIAPFKVIVKIRAILSLISSLVT